MKARIRRLHSPDIEDLQHWVPSDPMSFGFLLQICVGPSDAEGEESFDVIVCTPEWLRCRNGDGAVIPARHHLLVFRYDFGAIERSLHSLVGEMEGANWTELATMLARHGRWEFEDNRE